MRVVIDPGHGGSDPGAVGPTGLKEKDVVLAISLALAEQLKNYGITIRLTREDDRAVALYDRPRLANNMQADLLLSIHCNAFDSPQANGIEIFHSYKGDYGQKYQSEAKRIASIVQDELVQATGLADRGIKTRLVDRKDSPIYGLDYYAVIRKADCPTLLLEIGFITNPAEEALLQSTYFQQKTAWAIANGIARTYGFTDYTGHWAEKSIRKAIGAGIMKGYGDGTWRPEQPVTRAELAVILDRLGVL